MLKHLNFEIIHECSNKCEFCSSHSCVEREKIIDIDTFKKTIDHLMAKGGIEEISLSGGEPMLHPNIIEMISYCHNLGIRVVLFTSGLKRRTHLRPEDLSGLEKEKIRIARESDQYDYSSLSNGDIIRLEDSGLDKIVFDIHADTETSEQLMESKEMWPYIAFSMIRATYLKNMEIDVHFSPTKSNFRQLQDLVEHLNLAHIKDLSILNFIPQDRRTKARRKLMLSHKEMVEFTELFEWAEKEFNGTIKVGAQLKDKKQRSAAELSEMMIKYDGTVLPCDEFEEISTADLRKRGISVAKAFSTLENVGVHPTGFKPFVIKNIK